MGFKFKEPTEEEKEAVRAMQATIAAKEWALKFTDVTVLRFLRGHKGNADKAVHFMEKHIEWRKEHNVDAITVDTVKEEYNKRRSVLFGRDKEDRPILYVFARRHNAYDRDLADMEQLIIYFLEELVRRSNPANEQMMIAFDLHGFGMNCMDYEVVQLLIRILQFNYPDVLGTGVILNAPFVFTACWYVIKPWLDPVTASKIIFCSTEEMVEHTGEGQIHRCVGRDDAEDGSDLIEPDEAPTAAASDSEASSPAAAAK